MVQPTVSAFSYCTTFISHAHADNARCTRIAALLKAKGIDLWIDLTNLQKGHALSTDITASCGDGRRLC